MNNNKILIVDDNKVLISLVSHYNVFWELDIDYSYCAEDALGKLKKTDYKLLFLDMKLPDASGTEVIPLAKGIRPELKIIAITGGNQSGYCVESRTCGFDGFSQKPFRMMELRNVIKKFENNDQKEVN